MNAKRHTILAACAGLAVGLGLVAAALAQMETMRRQYETRLRNTDMSDADEVLGLAKWCYQNRLTDEAVKLAKTAHQLAPKDVRPKYLIYALAGGPVDVDGDDQDGDEDGDADMAATTTGVVSDEKIEALWNEETPKAMNAFREVQEDMIRRCGGADCHGGNPRAKFNLIATSLDSRQTIVRNFMTIQQYLNREEPAESALVQTPMKGPDEGHPRKVIRSKSDRFYRAAVEWIDQLLTDVEKVWERSQQGPVPAG